MRNGKNRGPKRRNAGQSPRVGGHRSELRLRGVIYTYSVMEMSMAEGVYTREWARVRARQSKLRHPLHP